MSLVRVTNGGEEYAIIIKSSFNSEGIHFFTNPAYSQQLGYFSHPKGYKIKAHSHKTVTREVLNTSEVLFIRTGKVKVNFFDDTRFLFQSEILHAGDVILLIKGGHGFEMLIPSEIIEVKQGPYAGDQDKDVFE